jgi:nitroreductase
VSDADVTALLEAARWAPSANNHQPWRFLVGRHGFDGADATHKGLFDALAEFNQVWASPAPVLITAIVELAVGRLGDPESLPAWAAERESAPRDRKPLTDIAYAGQWGTAFTA